MILATLPLGIFFYTTPQNLAYLFLILVIIRGLSCRNYFDIVYIFTLSLASLLAQPIAGIPAILLSIAVTIHHSDLGKIRNHLYRLVFILASISLPIAFFIVNKTTGSINTNQNNALDNTPGFDFSKLSLHLPLEENIILNFVYFFGLNIRFFIFLILIFGAYTVFKYKNKFQIYKIYLLIAIGIFISFFITTNLSFDYLINYERSAFATRLFTVSLFLLIPFFIVSVFSFINSLSEKKLSIKIILFAFFLILVPAFLYLNYPRLDNYHNSHGYSVGQSDLDAVHYIENNADNDYIVLANQQTSVAALREFGFTKYYRTDDNQEIFYYPIPTGGPLYTHFLTMVDEKPSRDTMLKAMNLANVNTGYFAINKYWWAFPKIIEEAKIEADSWESINNGEIFVFKYTKQKGA